MDFQKLDRRTFAKQLLWLSGAMALPGIVAGSRREQVSQLCILHTNDTHSRIDPYPLNDPHFPGMGGYARRAALIQHIRKNHSNVLLLDAGDIFQGTHYFNAFGGEPELRLMTLMHYDAATMGNHEFDNGLEGFDKVLPYAAFPFITSNYDFSRTILREKTLPYKILSKANLKIGIYGLGIDLKGLVSENLYGNTVYRDPVEVSRKMETFLRENHKCDLIICLSHLGYKYDNQRVSDLVIARSTRYTNIIIGGHTHSILNPVIQIENARNKKVYIGQAGYGGVNLGRMDVYFDENNGEFLVDDNTLFILNKQDV
jgi:5'-nucleotidase